MIAGYEVTTASVHCSEALETLLNKKEDQGQPFYANNAYRSEAIEKSIKKKDIELRIQEKWYRNKPLTKRQQERNRKKSKVRARVEHIFAYMETACGEYASIAEGQSRHRLMNKTYNLFRLTQLKVCPSVA